MEFTYDAYFRFLDQLRAANYEVRSFDGRGVPTQSDDRALLLRHDVDLDLDRAVALAEREYSRGIAATYFVLLTSPFYNPASAYGRKRVSSLVALGHSIGLHFDASVYGCERDAYEFNRRCNDEAQQLEGIAGVPVEAVSFHRPAPMLLGAGLELTTPRIHTYLPQYVQQMEYCSDSTGVWRFGPPDQREAIALGRAMHFLTHAEWWGDTVMPRNERIKILLSEWARRDRIAVPAELELPSYE